MKWLNNDDGSFGIVSKNLSKEIAKRQLDIPWVGTIMSRLDGPELPSGWQFLLFFVWELTAIHSSRIGRLLNINHIIGISRHAAHIVRTHGIDAHDGQLGVDVDIYRPLKTQKRASQFVFGSVIAANSRSGLDALLTAFRDAFGSSKEVLLKIKLYTRSNKQLLAYLDSFGIHLEILDNYWDFSEAQMCQFYNTLDCFVYPTRTTAWGMPLSEACACEVPCIVSDYSAPPEFIDNKIGWLVPTREVEVDWDYCAQMKKDHGWIDHMPHDGYISTPMWGDPSRADLVELLQRAIQNRDLVREKGRLAREKMIAQYQWSHALDRLLRKLTVDNFSTGNG